MMGWYPPLNELSDSTWHMFMHVVETNQHSLPDIYVHGGLYPTHACTRCELILMHVYDRCRSLVGRSSIFYIHFLKPKFIPYESTIPTYMRYLPAVPSKFACAKL